MDVDVAKGVPVACAVNFSILSERARDDIFVLKFSVG